MVFYLKHRPLQELTRQEAVDLKYLLLRKIGALEDKTSPVGKGIYKQLLEQFFYVEYCFFDSHFVRDKNGLLVLNEDFTPKIIEHPSDIKAIYSKIHPDLVVFDNNFRQ